MKLISICALGAAMTVSAQAVAADENTARDAIQPIELIDAQLDRISAGDLGLPNGNVQFAGFDNPAPDKDGYFGLCNEAAGFAFCHPSLTRRSTNVLTAQSEHYKGPTGLSGVNEGAWSAAFQSPVIDLLGF